MNTMCVVPVATTAGRLVRGLGLGLFVAAVAGCHPVRDEAPADTASDSDGTRCVEATETSAAQTGAVFIEIAYAPDGMPQVTPQRCRIADATRVTWRGPADEPVVFQIRFKAAAPVIREEGELLASRSPDGRYRVQRTLSGSGDYPYAVFANGKELDPAIIIR
jgi:hypothetical protein